jgi:hypothetical protein
MKLNSNKIFLCIIVFVIICGILYNFYEQNTLIENFDDSFQENTIETAIQMSSDLTGKFLRFAKIKLELDNNQNNIDKKLNVLFLPITNVLSIIRSYKILVKSDGTLIVNYHPKLYGQSVSQNPVLDKNIYAKKTDKFLELYIKFNRKIDNIKITYSQENLESHDLLIHGKVDSENILPSISNYKSLIFNEHDISDFSDLHKKLLKNLDNNLIDKKHYSRSNLVNFNDSLVQHFYNNLDDALSKIKINIGKNLILGNEIKIGNFKISENEEKLSFKNNSNDKISIINNSNENDYETNINNFYFNNNWKIKGDNGNIIFSQNDNKNFVFYTNEGKLGIRMAGNPIKGGEANISHDEYFGKNNYSRIVNSPWYRSNGYWGNKTTEVKLGRFNSKTNDTNFGYSNENIPLSFVICCKNNINRENGDHKKHIDKVTRGFVFKDEMEGFTNSSSSSIKSEISYQIKELDFKKGNVKICNLPSEGSYYVDMDIVSNEVLQKVKVICNNGEFKLDLSMNIIGNKVCFKEIGMVNGDLLGKVNNIDKYILTLSTNKNTIKLSGDLSTEEITKSIKENLNDVYISSTIRNDLDLNESDYKDSLIKTLNTFLGNKKLKFNGTSIDFKGDFSDIPCSIIIENKFNLDGYVFEIDNNNNLNIHKGNTRLLCDKNSQILKMERDGTDIKVKNLINGNPIYFKTEGYRNVLSIDGQNSNWIYKLSQKGGSKMSNRKEKKGIYFPLILNTQLQRDHIENFSNDTFMNSNVRAKRIENTKNIVLAKIKITSKRKFVKFNINGSESFLLVSNEKQVFINNKIDDCVLSSYKDNDNNIIVYVKNINNVLNINYLYGNLEKTDLIEHGISESNKNEIQDENNVITRYYKKETTENTRVRAEVLNKIIKQLNNIKINENELSKYNFKGGIIIKKGNVEYKIEDKNDKLVINDNNNSGNYIEITDNIGFTKRGLQIGDFKFISTDGNLNIKNKQEMNILKIHDKTVTFSTPIKNGSHVNNIYSWCSTHSNTAHKC